MAPVLSDTGILWAFWHLAAVNVAICFHWHPVGQHIFCKQSAGLSPPAWRCLCVIMILRSCNLQVAGAGGLCIWPHVRTSCVAWAVAAQLLACSLLSPFGVLGR